MATTRIMPLHVGKGRTESQAICDIIDYVGNPQKTDYGRLITSYACDSRVADAESTKRISIIALSGRRSMWIATGSSAASGGSTMAVRGLRGTIYTELGLSFLRR